MAPIAIPEEYRTPEGRIDVERVKSHVSLAAVAGRLTELKRSGDQLRGLCPFHDENTASFFVHDGKGVWHCFGCGRGGDAVTLMREAGEPDFVHACGRLLEVGRDVPVRPAPRQLTREQRRLRVALAQAEWRRGVPVRGTPAEDYLAARGILGAVPGSLRFAMVPQRWSDDGRPGPRRPALIAAAQDVMGRVVGIQRTFIDPSRRGYPFRPLRLSLGRIRGAALRLGPAADTIMLTGSVEDGLSLQRMFVGASVWVSLGEANLAHVTLPKVCRRAILAGDADEPGRVGAGRAQSTFRAQGRSAEQIRPRAGKDFNDEWLMRQA